MLVESRCLLFLFRKPHRVLHVLESDLLPMALFHLSRSQHVTCRDLTNPPVRHSLIRRAAFPEVETDWV